MPRILQWSITVALAGFLFGFDTAVISGADTSLQSQWGLSDLMHGLVIMSMALWGTVIGAIFGNWPTDHFGRRATLIGMGSSIWSRRWARRWPPTPTCSRSSACWGARCWCVLRGSAHLHFRDRPRERRGALVGLYQFNVVFGIVIAFVSNYFIGFMDGENWRWMLGVEAVPAVLYLLMICKVPRSPRWLILKRNDEAAAAEIIRLINPKADIAEEIAIIRGTESEESAKQHTRLFAWRYRLPILFAFLIAAFNQLSGINFIIYYAPRILAEAQLESSAALLSTAGIGVINLVFTMLGMSLIDKLGRRTLILIGSAGYLLSLCLIAWAFHLEDFSAMGGYGVPILLGVFIAAHAMSQGTVIWVFISEIFPNKVRAMGQSFGSSVHWIFAALIALLMPTILSQFSGGPVFAFFAFMMLLQLIFVLFFMPETKGVSLEELQGRLVRPTRREQAAALEPQSR
ncbi:sugar porter family MFS transporter [Cobetia marina]